ncbi:MAG: ABC transporter permease [Chloroflexota bacterium]|nr:ABC transporter permease [Chloroflexota bacterium]
MATPRRQSGTAPLAVRLLPVSLVLLSLGGWELAVWLAQTPSWLLPPPSAIGLTLVEERGLLLHHGLVTLREVVLGFALAFAVGVLLAVLIDTSPTIERALYPLIVASQTVPVPAVAPLMLIWFGYGLLPKVLITAVVAFFPVVVNTVDGLRAADREVLDAMSTLGAGRWARFRYGKLPMASPFLFSGARVAVSVAVIGAVFGELFGASAGLGYLLDRSLAQFQTARVFAAVALLSVMAVGLFALVVLAERVLLPWRRHETGE